MTVHMKIHVESLIDNIKFHPLRAGSDLDTSILGSKLGHYKHLKKIALISDSQADYALEALGYDINDGGN